MATAKKSTTAKSATAGKATAKKTASKSSPATSAGKAPAKKAPAKKAAAKKRTLVEPNPGDKRFVRRDEDGRFDESDDAGKSLAADVRTPAKRAVKSGQGDRGDQKPKGSAAAKKKSSS